MDPLVADFSFPSMKIEAPSGNDVADNIPVELSDFCWGFSR